MENREEAGFNMYISNVLDKNKTPYVLTEKKSQKTAIWNKKKNFGIRLRSQMTKEELKTFWVYGAVSQSCKKWLAAGNEIKFLEETYARDVLNFPKIRGMRWGKKYLATDINNCYWRIANIEGYIDDKLFNKLLPDKDHPKFLEYKNIRNKALACIKNNETKTTTVTFTKKLGKKKEKIEYTGDGRLSDMYDDLRNKAHYIMHQLMVMLKNDFIMYKTDCIYYEEKHQRKVEKFLDECGVKYKTFECEHRDAKNYVLPAETEFEKKYRTY